MKRDIFRELDRAGICYGVTEHPAVFTIEEMDSLQVECKGQVLKNLFLREDKKKRYFLVVLTKEKKIDLKALQASLGSRHLGFASERDLDHFLGLSKGAVSPLGILNDIQNQVEVVVDADIAEDTLVGVHPNDNTATVWIGMNDLIRLIESHGNQVVRLAV